MTVREYLITSNQLYKRSKIKALRDKIRAVDFKVENFSFQTEDRSYAQEQEKIAKSKGHSIISCFDDEYPAVLRQLYDFPLVLYCHGNLERLADSNKIAIVGSRKASYDGKKMCDTCSKLLAKLDYTIVSGLALGIDALAHRGALAYGAKTIAILASSVDEITPKTNYSLAQKILENNGLLISESNYNEKLYPAMFVYRNRLVSGLCEKVFIVEAAKKSGSLTTAKHALEQNKTVYAMPGSISNPVAYGTNRLIQSGAYPVLEAEDLFIDISAVEVSPDGHPIIQLLEENGILSIEELALKIDLPINLLLPELSILECSDKLEIVDNQVLLK